MVHPHCPPPRNESGEEERGTNISPPNKCMNATVAQNIAWMARDNYLAVAHIEHRLGQQAGRAASVVGLQKQTAQQPISEIAPVSGSFYQQMVRRRPFFSSPSLRQETVRPHHTHRHTLHQTYISDTEKRPPYLQQRGPRYDVGLRNAGTLSVTPREDENNGIDPPNRVPYKSGTALLMFLSSGFSPGLKVQQEHIFKKANPHQALELAR